MQVLSGVVKAQAEVGTAAAIREGELLLANTRCCAAITPTNCICICTRH